MDRWLFNLRKKVSKDFAKENMIRKNAHVSSNIENIQITGLFENKRMFRVWGYISVILFIACLYSSIIYFAHQAVIDDRYEKSPKYYNLRGSHENRESNPYTFLFASICVLFAGSIASLILVYVKPTKVTITKNDKLLLLQFEGIFFKTPEMKVEKIRIYQLLEHQKMYFTPVYLSLLLETEKGEFVLGDLITDSRNYGFPQYDAGELAIQLRSLENDTVYSMAKFLGLV